jgi:diguanylate cyclase (GGDEF)-like protein
MHLDLATVLVLHPAALVVGALCFLSLRWRAPQMTGLGVMALAFLILAAGSLLAGAGERGQVNFTVWTLVSFSTGPLAYTLLWIGLRSLLLERRAKRAWLLLIWPAALTVTAVLSGFHLANLVRASVFLSNLSLMALACAWLVISDPLRQGLTSRYWLSTVFVAKALIGLCAILSIGGPDWLGLTPADIFTILILCQFAIAMFVLVLVQERAERRLIMVSETDALTGVHNRRWLYDRLPADAAPGDVFIALDIDHFKSINDRHGHAAGDLVLAAVAQRMAGMLPRDALFARVGGEEFTLFLPGSTSQTSAGTAEDLRAAVEELAVQVNGERIPVTVSIGVAVAREPEPLASLIGRADNALYAAKRAGRNRVVSGPPERAPEEPGTATVAAAE